MEFDSDPFAEYKRQIEFEQQRNQFLEKRFDGLWKTTDRLRADVSALSEELECNSEYIRRLEAQIGSYGIRGKSIWKEEVLMINVELHHEMVNWAIGNDALEQMLRSILEDVIEKIMRHVDARKNSRVIT